MLELNKIYQGDCLEIMKGLPDNSIDLIFTDPPYALGSEITIRADGRPDYKKAVDFMNKWEMPTGDFWEQWYKEVFRVLKYGGHCLMFGMDRQNFMFKYYGHLAGFTGKQSLYWYFISNFPKASDLSKMIDKNAGAEREIIGSKITGGIKRPDTAKISSGILDETRTHNYSSGQEKIDITAPSTPLAKKYSGYKYSVAPLKQVVEEIMVFQKPMKTGSVLHDVLAMENGDESITCGALDIEKNRCGFNSEKDEKDMRGSIDRLARAKNERGVYAGVFNASKKTIPGNVDNGRFPAQAFLTGTEDILDEQSGISGSGKLNFKNRKRSTMKDNGFGFNPDGEVNSPDSYGDTGDCSKILHKCPYEDSDLFIYSPKVNKKERGENNKHPTLKPQKLLTHILRLFKTPNKQICLDAFAGSGSTLLACKTTGYDFIGVEINPDYVEIANQRIKELDNKLLC